MPISSTVIKTLFALSGNVCAYPACEQRLTDPSWNQVMAEMAHICGERPGSARHDPALPPEVVNGHGNLILVCPTHHTLIDIEPQQHPVELLEKMKQGHEERSLARSEWATQDDLDRYVGLLVTKQELALMPLVHDVALAGVASVSAGAHAALVKAQGPESIRIEFASDGGIDLVNDSHIRLFGAGLEFRRGSTRTMDNVSAPIPPVSLAPGERWRAGYVGQIGIADPEYVYAHWKDETGERQEVEVPFPAA